MSANILEIRGLVVRFGTGHKTLTAVDGIDLDVPRGGILGLVGESGSGKSTVARAVVGLARPAGGQILLNGTDLTAGAAERKAARRTVQMIFQDPYASLNPRMRVSAIIGEALRTRGTGADKRGADRIPGLLEEVGLDPATASRYPRELSGGQRQRVAIARALAVEPELIIADEITSSLDVSVQAQVLNLLRDIQRRSSLSVLFIAHNVAIVRYLSDAVAVMHMGRVVEAAPAAEFFGAPHHPYSRTLLDAVPQLASAAGASAWTPVGEPSDPHEPPAGCRFHPRCPVGPAAPAGPAGPGGPAGPAAAVGRDICRTLDPGADAAERPHRAACHFAGMLPAPSPAVISVTPGPER
jgi:peptide/nickel transport system ATP-binding protein